jgi:hypothetical protein
MTGDLVTQNQGQRVTCGYTVDGKSDVGVADAAAGNLNHDLVGVWLERRQVDPLQRLAGLD